MNFCKIFPDWSYRTEATEEQHIYRQVQLQLKTLLVIKSNMVREASEITVMATIIFCFSGTLKKVCIALKWATVYFNSALTIVFKFLFYNNDINHSQNPYILI